MVEMERKKLFFHVLLKIILLRVLQCDTASALLTTSSIQEFGRNESCPGEIVVFTCNRSSFVHLLSVQTDSMVIQETVTALTTQPRTVSGFTFALLQVISGDRIVSTVTVESSPALDGVVITCSDASGMSSPDPVNITAQVVDLSVTLPPPTVLSPFSVRVSPVLQNTPTVGQPCTGVYGVEVSTGGSVVGNVTNSTANIVITNLELCIKTYSFVAFFASNSDSTRSQANSLNVTPSDLGLGSVSGVVQVVRDGSDTLMWNSPDTSMLCVEGYTLTVNHSNGTQSQVTTSDTSFPVSRLGLTECVSVTVRVSPRVPVFPAPLDSLSGTGTATNFPQNFIIPEIDVSYCYYSDGNQRVFVAWQPVTDAVNTILVGSSTTKGGCNATLRAPSRQNHTFDMTTSLPVEVCVSFQRNGCTRDSTASVPVSPLITDINFVASCPTLFNVTLTVETSLLCDMTLDSYTVQALLRNNSVDAECENGVCTAAVDSSVGGLITGQVVTAGGQVLRGPEGSTVSVGVLGYCECNMGVCVAVPVVIVGGGGLVLVIILLPVGYHFSNKKKDKPDSSKSKSRKDSEKQGLTGSSPPPEDRSPYADPNKIEHQNAPGTEDQYAMVDVSGKKKKPTQDEGLYQRPDTIEHTTAPTGEMYAVVDKPKRGGSSKKEPDVVPPQGAEGLTYADIDVSNARRNPKPVPQRQAQDPGHVEYVDVARM